MNKEDEDKERWAEEFIRINTMSVNGGLDPDIASEAIHRSLSALRTQAEVLQSRSKELLDGKLDTVICPHCKGSVDVPVDVVKVSKAMASTAKVIDETHRLMAFAAGGADSRPDIGNNMLQGLSDDQVVQVARWIEENKKAVK